MAAPVRQSLLSRLGKDEVEVLVEHLGPLAICALRGAAELARDEALQGYLQAPTEVATWVLAQPAPNACLVAAGQGRLDRLRLAVRHGCAFDGGDCLPASAMATCLDPLRWLLFGSPTGPSRGSVVKRAVAGAAHGGHLEALQLLYSCSCILFNGKGNAAARGGHLETLQWIHKQGVELDADTCAAAAHAPAECAIAVLQWLHQTGSPWDERTCAAAAGLGNLPLLKWLRDPERAPPCPWDSAALTPGDPRESDLCQTAARGGHDEVLQWLRSAVHGTPCPWDDEAVTSALLHRARSGDIDPAVLRWMHGEAESPDALHCLASFLDQIEAVACSTRGAAKRARSTRRGQPHQSG